MDIHELCVLDCPNIYNIKEPVVIIKVKMGELTDSIKNAYKEIVKLFPEFNIKHEEINNFKYIDDIALLTVKLCLGTQKMLGYEMDFYKVKQVEDDIYNLIFSCPHLLIGKACGVFVIDVINSFIAKIDIDVNKKFDDLKRFSVKYDLGVSTKAIINEAKNRGIPVSIVNDGELVRLGYGKYQKMISATLYEGTSSLSVDIACNKELTKLLLDEALIPVPKGKSVFNIEEALAEADIIGYPVVVKPRKGNKGKNVYVNVTNKDDLKICFEKAFLFDGEVIIEKYIKGKDYRILTVNGKVVAAAERIPAFVTGDGKLSIEKLIDNENKSPLRGDDHERPLTKIKIDENVKAVLDKQGLSLSSVAKANQKVWLRENANLSTGGQAYDCTELIHPDNIKIFEETAKIIGLDIAGIDVVTPDISKSICEDHGAIVEVNAAPGIRMHLNPSKGMKRDVASSIIDMIFPKGKPYTIPIVSITGTNGKTTTTRLISNILRRKWDTVGTTTTHGIYLNDNCIEDGDTTGPISAKRILNNRNVDAAVLETARGGIIRSGLAFDKADVAVFTNLTDDHLGIDGINTLDELLDVKSLVIRTVKEEGVCVLNADDKYVMKASKLAMGKQILFSVNDNNPIISEHIDKGGIALYKRNNFICISNNKIISKFINLSEIPATLEGKLKHNIYNCMAAIGASIALDVPFDDIKGVLKEFNCDVASNPGRFNIFDTGNFKVVLDYGHNIEGYRVTIDGLNSLNPKRLIGVIGVPGDRLDSDITNVGKISGSSFNYIYIKEDKDLRGRKPFAVANLLYNGALSSGASSNNIEIIPNEEDALKSALQHAQKDDVIVVFFEKMEPLVKIINDFESKARKSKSYKTSVLERQQEQQLSL